MTALRPLALCAFGLALLSASASAADCSGALQISATPEGNLDVTVSLPCAPYTPITLLYGPVKIPEETAADGSLNLTVPRLKGVSDIAVLAPVAGLSAPVPSASLSEDQARFILVLPDDDGAVPGLLPPLGFDMGTGIAPPEFLALGPTQAAELVIPVSPGRCGQPFRLRLLTESTAKPQRITITMPDCPADGFVLLPL
ncbi:MAG: hypothetical protein ACPGNV_09960 [Mangrovicoccus sp.]